MTEVEKAIEKYVNKFGGFPSFLFMGAEDDFIIESIESALKSGKEIEPNDEDMIF